MSRRRRTYRAEWGEHLSGVSATFDGDCARCPDPILVGQRVVKTPRGWMHITCHSGFSDE